VAVSTLRRWDKEGRLKPTFRTFGNHRRYAWVDLQAIIDPDKPACREQKVIGYARVSSHGQKSDFVRQADRLKVWSESNLGVSAEVIRDLGSGLNMKKAGLKKLLRMISTAQFDHLILTHKDRLLRFGSELMFDLCRLNGIRVTIIDEEKDQTYEQKLSADVIELMTVFSARLYGKRSHKNRKKAA
jgi:predicted site-specific integrase-resolvase